MLLWNHYSWQKQQHDHSYGALHMQKLTKTTIWQRPKKAGTRQNSDFLK
jgi:hypothetical protein